MASPDEVPDESRETLTHRRHAIKRAAEGAPRAACRYTRQGRPVAVSSSVRARLRRLVWPLAIVVLATAFYTVLRAKRDLVDFEVYRTAGLRILHAESLYRPSDGHYQFKYLPAFALASTPFAWLPAEVAKGVWFAIVVGLLLVFVEQAVRALPDPRLRSRQLTGLAALLMGKFYVKELVFGQTNLLLGVVVLAALAAAVRDRRIAAGLWVGLAVFVKPYAVILAPWLAAVLGPTAMLAFGATVLLGLVVPSAVYGWAGNLDQLAGWYRTVTQTTGPNLLGSENVSLATMWAKWIGSGPAATVLAAATGLLTLVVAVVVWRQRTRVRQPAYLEVGLLMLLVPLLSPQGWDYVLLLATPALLCLVDRWRDVTPAWRLATGTAIGLMSFTIFDLLGRWLYTRLMALSVVTICALIMLAALAHLRARALA
jgi:Glycosyltransferase family 87